MKKVLLILVVISLTMNLFLFNSINKVNKESEFRDSILVNIMCEQDCNLYIKLKNGGHVSPQ